MLISDLPDDILNIFVNKLTLTVCTHWYDLWRKKFLVIDLRQNENIDLRKYPNIIGLHVNQRSNLFYVDMMKLKILHLGANYDLNRDSLIELTNLTELSLYKSYVGGNSSIEKLTNLVSLDIFANSHIYPDVAFSLPKLTKFAFSKNFVKKNPYECLSQIRELHIGNNVLDKDLALLTSLTKLELSHRYQYDISPLYGLTNLTSISMSYCHLPIKGCLEILKKYAPNLKEIVENDNIYGMGGNNNIAIGANAFGFTGGNNNIAIGQYAFTCGNI
jgi:hypothetical protein